MERIMMKARRINGWIAKNNGDWEGHLSSKRSSIRLPERLFEQLGIAAHQKDISCQSLMKVYLAKRVKEELEATV